MTLVFFDTETTGNGSEDRLCQLAVKERGIAEPLINTTYRPPIPISFGAMAVHHITEKMIAERPRFVDAPEYGDIKNLFEHPETISVAHNASFDIGMLSREGIVPSRTICTYKVVSALDPEGELEQYKLQYLRYYFGLDIEATAHDALGDVVILEAVFEHLLAWVMKEIGSEEAAIAEMIAISSRPKLFTTIRFGKYRGKRVEEIAQTDPSYLQWLLREKKKDPAGEEDWIYTLEQYVGART
jgi:exodeoxyribonuclease X